MNRFEKWSRLKSPERHLILHALLLLTISRLTLNLFQLKNVYDLLQVLAKVLPVSAQDSRQGREQIAWAVTAAGKSPLGDGTCLARALTAQRLLKMRGYPANLHIGVAKDGDGQLLAHAWVESDGVVVVGGTVAELNGYARMAGFEEVFL
jgi:hypothetical protein